MSMNERKSVSYYSERIELVYEYSFRKHIP